MCYLLVVPHLALASPDSAGGGLGRARVVSGDGCCFRFFLSKKCSNPKRLFARIGTSQSLGLRAQESGPSGRPLSLRAQGRCFISRTPASFFLCAIFTFFGVMYFFTSIKICAMIIDVSGQSRSQFYMHTVAAAAAALLLYCCCCCRMLACRLGNREVRLKTRF